MIYAAAISPPFERVQWEVLHIMAESKKNVCAWIVWSHWLRSVAVERVAVAA